ncbi:MAG: integration host factor subunit beta [Gammaproteobacteria bacterium]|nr:integration host factor subunit beta [Pseudomonadota bacterium]MCH9662448.1 integration host factor subunit beta [Gammaproteobacteria bacterium]
MGTPKKVAGRLELIERIYSRQDLLRQDEIKTAVDVVLSTITRFMSENERIEIRGFGSFTLRQRPERMGRNPKTGEVKLIASRYTPHFKASRSLSDEIESVEPNGQEDDEEE